MNAAENNIVRGQCHLSFPIPISPHPTPPCLFSVFVILSSLQQVAINKWKIHAVLSSFVSQLRNGPHRGLLSITNAIIVSFCPSRSRLENWCNEDYTPTLLFTSLGSLRTVQFNFCKASTGCICWIIQDEFQSFSYGWMKTLDYKRIDYKHIK